MTKNTRYLIIGSGIAGYNALKELMNLDPKSKITMITSDKYYPYDRPPLSKDYLRGKIERPALFFENEDFYKKDNLEILLNTTVVKINNDNTAELNNKDYIAFEKALIATGGRPRKLGINGENTEKVYYLRTLDDCDKIKNEAKNSKNVIIVGGGFIGIEVASSLTSLGIKTTVIEVMPYIWNTFVDEKISKFIQQYFENHGVSFILNDGVKEIGNKNNKKEVITNSGKKLESDFVLIAVGITPNVDLAQNSNIEVNNGILANEYLQTNKKNVFVAGDVANILDPITGKRRRIEHWNNAEYTGKLASRNMTGKNDKYNFLSSVWSDIFDLHIESAGDTRDYDEYIIRGKYDLDNPSFNVIYLKGGLVRGYLAINRDFSELSILNTIISEKIDISNKKQELLDETFDINKLLNK
ncbi:pyridine nucleotide-disulfide oxidoreductase [Acidianus manzaensis]|uniref:Pyridine nucleotide-disulfide oxidoreductase n=2 Tax=Acidianus manzaensis TaxID=282676 RepID=A0A1W6JYZ6_9CREN|nr:pyridine nucleotide-disulfide oxidoreductase [Acidianus manzaensis]